MFVQRICFFFWLSPILMFRDRGVQGLFNIKPFGEEGEHLSHDSASWNSRDFYNPQQNIHADFSNQMAGEYNDWGDEISPVDEWNNHPDSAPNIEDAMNYHLQNTWNYETVEHSSLPGHNHQEVSYPHVGSSQDQASSSNNIQPVYNEDFYYGNHVNFEPHSNEWHPVPSFLSQTHQNVEFPHYGQVTGNPDFHSIQNDLSYIPHLPETSNRVYQNLNWDASNVNPASSIHNSGFMNSGAETDHHVNSKKNQNSVFSTSINPPGEELLSNIGADKSYKEMSNLMKVLAEEFLTGSNEMAIIQAAYRTQGLRESKNFKKENLKNKKYIDEQISKILYLDKRAESNTAYPLESAIFRHKIFTSTENVYRIQWINYDALKEEIGLFSENFVFEKAQESNKCTQEHMEKISIMGITFMKIISKKYPENLVSEEFGDDKSLIEYTKLFWRYCFSSHAGNEEALTGFFMSIRRGTSNDYIKEILLTDFIREEINQDQIISFIRKKITSKTYRDQVYMFAWHFCYIRTVVYYPELLINIRKNNRDLLRNFIESGILYHLRLQDYDVNR